MNRRTWIAGITATTLLAASLTACKQEQQGEETGQALPVMVVSSQPIEFEETYSASIRGLQDVDIIPQVSGRIIRLCVKEGEQVKTGQVLAVIDQTPYQAALRIAIANVSAARAKVETARIELNGKQSLFDEKVISDYELSVARNQLVVGTGRTGTSKSSGSKCPERFVIHRNQESEQRGYRHAALSHRRTRRSHHRTTIYSGVGQFGDVCLFLHFGKQT